MKKQIHPEPEQYASEVDKHRPKEQAVPNDITSVSRAECKQIRQASLKRASRAQRKQYAIEFPTSNRAVINITSHITTAIFAKRGF